MAPMPFDLEGRWRVLSEEVMVGIKAWRFQPPKATLEEIEVSVEERMTRFRACMLQDVARASQPSDLSQAVSQERPVCLTCGGPVGVPRAPRAPPHDPPGPHANPGTQVCGVPDLSGRVFAPG